MTAALYFSGKSGGRIISRVTFSTMCVVSLRKTVWMMLMLSMGMERDWQKEAT